jgi:DNA modification methylase
MNKLFYGDNLIDLRKYIRDESIDLCYIDPPFNSKRNYNQIYNNIGLEDQAQAQAFIDTWTWDSIAEQGMEEIILNDRGLFASQSIDLIIGLEKVLRKGALLSYLVHITLRVAEIYRVLKNTGSFYLHCDPTASHYLKLIVDSVFCSRKGIFQNEIIWRRTGSHNSRKSFGPIHDVIFFIQKQINTLSI